jgi:hypothetical protein
MLNQVEAFMRRDRIGGWSAGFQPARSYACPRGSAGAPGGLETRAPLCLFPLRPVFFGSFAAFTVVSAMGSC